MFLKKGKTSDYYNCLSNFINHSITFVNEQTQKHPDSTIFSSYFISFDTSNSYLVCVISIFVFDWIDYKLVTEFYKETESEKYVKESFNYNDSNYTFRKEVLLEKLKGNHLSNKKQFKEAGRKLYNTFVRLRHENQDMNFVLENDIIKYQSI